MTHSLYTNPRILVCGDTGISVEFGDEIDLGINSKVHLLCKKLRARRVEGIFDLNPTYRSLFINYNPWLCSYERLVQIVEESLDEPDSSIDEKPNVVEIPVCYGGEFGPDLEEVAAYNGLSVDAAVELHSARFYQVYMVGFTPGFPYLGGLDERLFTPRKKESRKLVPAGSVGIADRQTGIYAISSPGGWQLIGKTPLKLFDIDRQNPCLIQSGDTVHFKAISKEEFESY